MKLSRNLWTRKRKLLYSNLGFSTMAYPRITVIGSGLAGSEAALTLARLGHEVALYEMRPVVRTAAHQTADAAELVCSNSLRSNHPVSAAGLLKEELRRLGGALIRFADQCAIPGGTALTVDRSAFSAQVTAALRNEPRITMHNEEVIAIPEEDLCIIATGPLTSDLLAQAISKLTGTENLAFYDAIAPVIDADSVDLSKTFFASRYDKGGADFLNCPMNREQYTAFREALLGAEGIFKHCFDELNFFGCMPLEELARRGEETLRFGPLKPVGLKHPATGEMPYAVVQLRQENLRSDSYNMVAFQNQLKFSEQQRVFRMIPGLENAEFMRFGQMHRNTYLKAPSLLNSDLSLRAHPNIFFAGQLCGVEGYVEAMATGLIAAVNASQRSRDLPSVKLARFSAIGAICHYLECAQVEEFAPLRFTFDLLPVDAGCKLPRQLRRAQQCRRALDVVSEFAREVGVGRQAAQTEPAHIG